MKNLFDGVVYDFLINESLNNRTGWGGNAGMIDGVSEYDLNNSRKGVEFMSNFLQEVKPKRIIETGTNYGSFSYVLYENLEEFELYTCDIIKDNSERCIKFINSYYNKENVKFIHDNSINFLKNLKNSGEKFDMAWLDSTHTYQYLIEELRIAAQMKIPYIVVDDFWKQKELQLSVFDFLKEHDNYKFHSYSNVRASVGAIIVMQLQTD